MKTNLELNWTLVETFNLNGFIIRLFSCQRKKHGVGYRYEVEDGDGSIEDMLDTYPMDDFQECRKAAKKETKPYFFN
jgi:hypothetical protein